METTPCSIICCKRKVTQRIFTWMVPGCKIQTLALFCVRDYTEIFSKVARPMHQFKVALSCFQ